MVPTHPEYIVADELAYDSNRRESYRMPPPAGSERASIKIGSKQFDCEIVDQSAGGYQISGTTLPVTPPTKSVELICGTGCHRVRVVWRRTVDDTLRMGLQRLPEEEVVVRSNSNWAIGMLVAIILCIVSAYLIVF